METQNQMYANLIERENKKKIYLFNILNWIFEVFPASAIELSHCNRLTYKYGYSVLFNVDLKIKIQHPRSNISMFIDVYSLLRGADNQGYYWYWNRFLFLQPEKVSSQKAKFFMSRTISCCHRTQIIWR